MASNANRGSPRRTISMDSQAISCYGAKDELLAFALARGLTRKDAATEAGYTERTAYAKLADPAFKQHVATLRGRMLDEAFGKLVDAGAGAIAVLKAVMDDQGQPGSTRLRAACEIIDSMIRVGSHVDLDQRIADLERRVDGQPDSPA